MKWLIALLLILAGCTVTQDEIIPGGDTMKLSSPAFREGDSIPAKFTCQGDDINPALVIEGVPSDAKSLALIVDDPDAPGGIWTHWLVKGIPANLSRISENGVPGEQVLNDFGEGRYDGPCPPSGKHRYFFKVYALKVKNFDASNKKEFYKQVEVNKIDEASLMGVYSKK